MRKIPEEVQSRVLELWLEGDNYGDVSSICDISTGTISSILDKIRRRAPDLDMLRKLNLKIRKQDSSVHDALRGSSLLEKLNQLGTSFSQLDDLIRILSEVAAERQIGEEELIDASIRLRKLEAESNKSYREIIKDFNEKGALIKRLEMGAEKIRGKTQKLNEEKRDIEDALGNIRAELRLILKTKRRLSKVNLEELDKLAEHAKKEFSLDTRIVERRNELESLRHRTAFLRKYVADIRRIDRMLEMRSINLKCPHCGCLSWRNLSRWECKNLLWNKAPLPVTCVHCHSTTHYDLTQMLVALVLEVLS